MTSVRDLLRASIQFYRENTSTVAGYLAWLLLPFAGLVLVSLLPYESVSLLLGLVLFGIETVLWFWLTVFLIRYINGMLDGKEMDQQQLQSQAWELLLPVLIVALIQTAVILGGFILFIIPGFIFVIWFSFAQISVILDGKQKMEALTYSRELVRGRFFKTAWRILGGPAIMLVVYMVIFATMISLGSYLTDIPVEAILMQEEETPLWFMIIDLLVEIFLITPLILIYTILVYREVKKTYKPLRDESK